MLLTEVGTRLFFTRPEREDRDTAKGAAASTVFHLLIILIIVLLTRAGILTITGNEQGVGTGIGAGPAGGGGGGGREQVSILIPAPQPQEPAEAALVTPQKLEDVKPPEPPKVEPPVPTVAKIDSVPTPPVTASPLPPTGGSGGGEGTGTGPGTGPGVGPGSGGGSGGGEGGGIGSGVGPGIGRGRTMAPSPEVLLIPPAAPGSVRGKTVVVRLAVDSTGVVRGADIIPPTGDRKYDAALKRVAMGWKFRAARDPMNRPVAVLFDVTFTF